MWCCMSRTFRSTCVCGGVEREGVTAPAHDHARPINQVPVPKRSYTLKLHGPQRYALRTAVVPVVAGANDLK